jgi:SAM-dependent methyltransferase
MTNDGAPAGDWPADGLEAVPACPVCGSTDRAVLHAGMRDRAFRAAPGDWTLVRCRACRSAYLDPRPTPATIELAYSSYYTHGSARPLAAGRLRDGLARDYRRARWGYSDASAIPGGRLIPKVAPSRGATVDREVRHLPANPGGRLLDVGCGSGAFVSQMAALGWRAEGIDPDPVAVAAARENGLDVRQAMLSDIDPAEHTGAFDAVTLSHVIEHMHHPGGELGRIHGLLRPGGLLWIATPNLDSLSFRRFGADWRGLEPPRHLVLFTTGSLERLIRDVGFQPLPQPTASRRAWPMFRESAALAQGRSLEEGPERGVKRLRALAALADWIAARDPRYSDELVMIARRP